MLIDGIQDHSQPVSPKIVHIPTQGLHIHRFGFRTPSRQIQVILIIGHPHHRSRLGIGLQAGGFQPECRGRVRFHPEGLIRHSIQDDLTGDRTNDQLVGLLIGYPGLGQGGSQDPAQDQNATENLHGEIGLRPIISDYSPSLAMTLSMMSSAPLV